MYLSHFGLKEAPFSITPDTSFAYTARAHQEALNTLLVALASGEGFIKITGEVGTGKTLLCRRFLATLGPEYVSAYIPNPLLEPRNLYLALADELGVVFERGADEYRLLQRLNQALLGLSAAGRKVVLCLDEAQALPLASLEALRLLSNLETEKRKLLHVVLFGQPELETNLADPSVRQLRQRIAFSYSLSGLARGELEHYLAHRMRVAGHRGRKLFSRPALARLHRASGGVPRLVNIYTHKALLAAYGEGMQQVRRRHVSAAVADGAPRRWWRWGSSLSLAVLAGVLLAGLL